jgi:hypothetical protein
MCVAFALHWLRAFARSIEVAVAVEHISNAIPSRVVGVAYDDS